MQFNQVTFHTVTDNENGQRIDNFLLRHLKKVPKSRIYRIIRKGEVRVNKKRIKAEYKLKPGDIVRIPPIRLEEEKPKEPIPPTLVQQVHQALIFEDEHLIALNKPSGLAVHGGSHSDYGVIEILRESRKELPYLELVHRLDRETSGVLLIAKSRPILQELHHLLREGHRMEKHYTALVHGIWKEGEQTVTHQLQRQANRTQKVRVSSQGKASTSIFTPLQRFDASTLMDVQIITGRMHQIRAQLAHLKYPIIGDTMYGDTKVNDYFKRKYQYQRLFLHASHIHFELHESKKRYELKASLPRELTQLIKRIS